MSQTLTMKYIKILILAFLSSLSYFSSAQTDTVYFDEVVITSGKLSSFYMDAVRVVQIITKDQIQSLPAQNINDLLEYAINADIRKRGADEVQADASIRGGSTDQTLIMLNGIRINDPQTGHHNLDIPVELSQVERVEILEGSGSRLYGANALCGIINIITNSPDKNFIKLSALAGMHDLYQGIVSGGLSTKKSAHFVSLSAKSCAGYTQNTDYDVKKAYYSGNVKTSGGNFELQAGYADKAFGANSFYSAKYPDQFEHTKTGFGSLKFTSFGKVKISPLVYWRRHHDRFELFRDEAPAWYKTHNYHLTDVIGSSVNARFNSKLGKSAVKAEYFFEKINSNVLGNALNDTLNDVMDPSGYFTKSAHRNNISLSFEHAYTAKKFAVSAGMLANYNEVYHFNFCPGIDASYTISPKVKWYVSASNSFRMPTFTDLYYVGPTNKGNSSLVPEKASAAESGIKFLHKGLYAHVAGFYRYGKDIIDWVKKPDSTKWESANVTELKTWGVESSVSIHFDELLKNEIPVKSIDIAYIYMNSSKASGDYVSYYVMDYLKYKFTLGINSTIYKKTGLSLTYGYSDRNGSYTDFSDGQEKDYTGFATVDMKIFWRPKNFDIYLSCNNIFEARYYDFGNIQMPGRWVSAGISYMFDFSKK